MVDKVSASWELEFPCRQRQELLHALIVRDLLHGASFDLEVPDSDDEIALDCVAMDESDGEVYLLTVDAEVESKADAAVVHDLVVGLFEEIVDEAEQLVAVSKIVDSKKSAEVVFVHVEEYEERWDLVVPDWLAPDGAEVPFGFRPLLRGSSMQWPTDEQLNNHGRLVVVPDGDELHLVAIPSPATVARGSVRDLPVV
jgi:hypothetical protein